MNVPAVKVDEFPSARVLVRLSVMALLFVAVLDVAVVMLCYALTLALIAWVGALLHLGALFYAGLGVSAALAGYHYTLIRSREPARCFKAFLHNNWIGASVFAGIAFDYLRQSGWVI